MPLHAIFLTGVKPVKKEGGQVEVERGAAVREGKEERMEMGCEAKKKKTGFHFTTTPTSDRHYLSVSHPFLSTTTHIRTHTSCPLVHSLPKLHQMSHQESLAEALQPDEEFEKFWKIFVERLKIEVAEAWRGRG